MSDNPNDITTDDALIRELMLMNLFAVFNERDPERRLNAIASNYTEDVIWTDLERTFYGREALNKRAPKSCSTICRILCSGPRGRSITPRSPPTWRSSTDRLSSRPPLPATTWRSCATDGSPCSTRY